MCTGMCQVGHHHRPDYRPSGRIVAFGVRPEHRTCLYTFYTHIHAYVYTHVYAHVYTHSYTHVYTHACTHVHAHVDSHFHTHVDFHKHLCGLVL